MRTVIGAVRRGWAAAVGTLFGAPTPGCSHSWSNKTGANGQSYQKCSNCGGTIPTNAE